MPATAFAAVATLQMELLGKNLITLLVVIKVFVFFDAVFFHWLNPLGRKFYLC